MIDAAVGRFDPKNERVHGCPAGCQRASCGRRVLVTRKVPPWENLDTFLGLGGVASWSRHSSRPGATTPVGLVEGFGYIERGSWSALLACCRLLASYSGREGR